MNEFISKETLINLGFQSNHLNHILCNLYLKSDTWRIDIRQEYKPMSNELIFSTNMMLMDNKGTIVKRSYLSDIKTIEELKQLANLTGINYEFGDN